MIEPFNDFIKRKRQESDQKFETKISEWEENLRHQNHLMRLESEAFQAERDYQRERFLRLLREV